jgi:glycosyltransferase involved in cell wall biosynthesis
MSTHPHRHSIPPEILAISHERDLLRRRGQYERADMLKQQIEDAGYAVKDNPHGAHLVILPGVEVDGIVYRTTRQLPSRLKEDDTCTFSVNILAANTAEQTRRCIDSVLRYASTTSLEIILVDNASLDGINEWAINYQRQGKEPRLHLIRATRRMGEAEARNTGLKQSRGRYILILDSSIELTGDIFTPLAKTLEQQDIGITGLRGLRSEDLRHFEESMQTEVEAIEGHCMAFKRSLLKQAGLFDEGYRYPHFMDIDFNFSLRDTGIKAVVTAELPVTRHIEPIDTGVADADRTRVTKRNFYRYLDKWGDREDLLLDEEISYSSS